MKKRNEKHEKRVKRMIVACGLCAIILTASTYAWFIGMKTVNVAEFDVKIVIFFGLSHTGPNNVHSPPDTFTDTLFNPHPIPPKHHKIWGPPL